MSVLGRVKYSYKDRKNVRKEKDIFVEISNYPQAELVDGVLILSIRNSLDYYNSSSMRKKIEDFLNDSDAFIQRKELVASVRGKETHFMKRRRNEKMDDKQPITIILDFSHVMNCDSASCFTLKKMVHAFEKQNVRVVFSGVRPTLKSLLSSGKVLQELGDENMCVTVEEAVDIFESGTKKRQTMTFHEIQELQVNNRNLI